MDRGNLLSEDYEEETQESETIQTVSPFLQFLLICVSVLLWIVSTVFVSVGAYALTQSMAFRDLTSFAIGPGVMFVVLGFVIFVMSIVGLLGARRQNLKLLNIYKILLVCVLVFEVFCGFIAAAYWPEIRKYIDQQIGAAIRGYTDGRAHGWSDMEGGEEKFIDMMQRQLECCGSLSIDDWDSNEYFSCKNVESYMACGVPWSCCLPEFYRNRHCGLGLRNTPTDPALELRQEIRRERNEMDLKHFIHTKGCMEQGFNLFELHMTLIAAFALANVVPLVCGTFITFQIVKQIRRLKKKVEGLKRQQANQS